MSQIAGGNQSSPKPAVTLGPGSYLLLWRWALLFLAIVVCLLAVNAFLAKTQAKRVDILQGIAVLVFVVTAFSVAIELASIRVVFHGDRLIVKHGIRPFLRAATIPFETILRVRAYDTPHLRVTLDLKDGRTVKVANALTEVHGNLPEVPFEEGKHTPAMVPMRRIAAFIESRIPPHA